MLNKVKFFIFNLIWVILCQRSYRSFKKSIFSLPKAQEKLLLSIIRNNQNTEFGRRYNFSEIRNICDFQKRVPISVYDSYIADIESICKGKENVLTFEAILNFALSSGSSAATKCIPYTKGLKGQFQKALHAWIFDLYTKRKKILFGSAYWSITPVISKKEKTEAGIPMGFEDDKEYFGLFERFLLKFLLVVPKEVCKIEDVRSFRYITLLFLLKAKDLSFISVWNPTFLAILLNPLIEWLPSLINDMRNGSISSPGYIDPLLRNKLIQKLPMNKRRAEELNAIFIWYQNNKLEATLYEKIWPNLVVISCWADGVSSAYLEELESFFPNVEIQGKGLLATEGFVSFPLIGEEGKALSIESHFFEFIEVNNNSLKLADELKEGKRYSVVITTAGGLYRYRLQDVIEVTGLKGDCPLIRFISKEDKISDLFGEKLNEYHVTSILNELFVKYSFVPLFFTLAPEKDADNDVYFYALFLKLNSSEGQRKISFENLNRFTRDLEGRLKENYHYRYCRKLGQLSHARLFIIEADCAVEIYNNICQSFGQREGDIKPAALHTKLGWAEKFQGYFLDTTNVCCM